MSEKYKKLPFDAMVEEDSGMITVVNPFSGASTELNPWALAVYDCIKGAEMLASKEDESLGTGRSSSWETVLKGLHWFRTYFPSEYMILLD
jgi:hypothetical protein